MKNLLLITAIFLLLQSCKDDVQPEPEKQYSIWYVNGQKITSNQTIISIGNGNSKYTCYLNNDRVGFTFYHNNLPESGEWLMQSLFSGQDPNTVHIFFYNDTTGYGVSPTNNNKLFASKVNGKVRYVMLPTWFYKIVNNSAPMYGTDSILIEGTFNES